MAINTIGYGTRTLSNPGVPITLPSGGLYTIPSGTWQVVPGDYTFLQWYDPVTALWLPLSGTLNSVPTLISSDGFNYRLANLTGTVVGAVVTAGGTGYTNGIYYPSGYPIPNNPNAVVQASTAVAPTATVAAGGGTIAALMNVVVGGAINATVTITSGGASYTRAPILFVTPPPAGGVPATMVCTISAGAINAVTVTNQGAGYTSAPTVTVVNSTGDTTGSGAVLTVNATLAQSGIIVALTPANGGAGMTSVPSITFSPASTSAATAIMCWTATTVTFSGPSHGANGNMSFIGSALTAGTSTTTNPAITTGLFVPRVGYTTLTTTAGVTTTTILDGGLHQIVPNAIQIYNSDGTISAATTTTIAQGGVTDFSLLLPA